MDAYIKAITYYLPERAVSNEELVAEFPEWTVEKVASKVGIRERRVAACGETAADMAVRAAERLFDENAALSRSDIDFVLFCTQSPDYFLPTSACIIQNRLGLSTGTGALDFNLGCSGYVYGLCLAKGLISSGAATNVLLLTAETYSKYLHPRDKGNRTIFGDAASATVVSGEGFARIGAFALGTDGRGADNLIVRSGCARHPGKAGDLVFDEHGNPRSADYLFMDGAEIFNFTIEAVPALVSATLANNFLGPEDVDLYVFHQANRYMMDFLRKKLRIVADKFYYCLENVGNTVSSTVPIALVHALGEDRLHGNVLLAGFGVGYSWAGTVLRTDC